MHNTVHEALAYTGSHAVPGTRSGETGCMKHISSTFEVFT